MFNSIFSNSKSLNDYAIDRMDSLFDAGIGAVKNRVILGVSLYPILCLSKRIFVGYENSSIRSEVFACPPEILQMNTIQRILGPAFVVTGSVGVAMIEELLFREVIQNYALKEGVSSLLGRISPNLVRSWNGPGGKLARIAIVATLFSVLHMPQDVLNEKLMTHGLERAIEVFSLGVITAALQEADSFGSISAIGLHATNNAIGTFSAVYKILSKC